jgi:hypothetical protein
MTDTATVHASSDLRYQKIIWVTRSAVCKHRDPSDCSGHGRWGTHAPTKAFKSEGAVASDGGNDSECHQKRVDHTCNWPDHCRDRKHVNHGGGDARLQRFECCSAGRRTQTQKSDTLPVVRKEF